MTGTTCNKPPFLFRAAGDESRGLSTADAIDPLFDRDTQYHASLAELASKDYNGARMMIYDHINYQYKMASEFSSWSVSLLYVLVHAVQKAYACGASVVIVYVMDTRLLEHARVHKAADLVKSYDVGDKFHYRKTTTQLLELVDGERMSLEAAHIDQLIEAGLYKGFKQLRYKAYKDLLLVRVKELRHSYFNADRLYALVPPPEILDVIKGIAKCFGGEIERVMVIALLALNRRDLSSEHVSALMSEIGPTQPLRVPFDTNKALRTMHMGWRNVPEAKQFMQILRLLHDLRDAVDEENDVELNAGGDEHPITNDGRSDSVVETVSGAVWTTQDPKYDSSVELAECEDSTTEDEW